ncbi:MAG: 2-hydroxyglutaryl-CoA dehydratase, partial [bacterium]
MPPRSTRQDGAPEPTRRQAAPPAQPPNGRLEAELIAFEAAERERLGLPPAITPQWTETVHTRFTRDQRERTTILLSGLTDAHEVFLVAALNGLGYRARRLDCPDNEAMWVGKEFGSRGMCNPSYFTVGNLLKFLRHLHEEQGLSKPEIMERYLMLTVNGCGPCRFGMYLTEYRKALRDSGFEGFRVLLLGQTLINQDLGEGGGLEINTRVIIATLKSMMLGDIINLLAYRIRPYETVPGATDAAMESCKTRIALALERRAWLPPVLWRCRRELARIPVER